MQQYGIISERIRNVLDFNNISQRDISREIGISEIAFSRILNQHGMPKITTIIKIAKACNCTSDYILGLSDELTGGRKTNMSLEMRNTVLAERIEKELRDKNLSGSKLANIIGISNCAINKILNGKTNNPTRPVLEKMARYFGCSPEELTTGDRSKGTMDYDNFEMCKREAIKAAIELCYGEQVEHELKAATTITDINRIMKSARDKM